MSSFKNTLGGQSKNELIRESVEKLKNTLELLENELSAELQNPGSNKESVKEATLKVQSELNKTVSNLPVSVQEPIKSASVNLQKELEQASNNPGSNHQSLKSATVNLTSKLSQVQDQNPTNEELKKELEKLSSKKEVNNGVPVENNLSYPPVVAPMRTEKTEKGFNIIDSAGNVVGTVFSNL